MSASLQERQAGPLQERQGKKLKGAYMTRAGATKPKSGFEKWQDGINEAVGNDKWNIYDCEIQLAVNEFIAICPEPPAISH